MMAATMITAALQQLPLWNEGTPEAGWQVRRSRRARRPSVKVYRDGAVEIVVPERLAVQQIENFVARHRGWIERHQCAAPADLAFPPTRLELRALGETWHCRAVLPAGRLMAPRAHRSCACATGGILELQVSAGSDAVRDALLDWLAERAAATLEPRLKSLADELAVDLPACANSSPAYPLGKLFGARHGQPQLLPAVPAAGRGALPAGA